MIWSRFYGLAFAASLVSAGTYHNPLDHSGPDTPPVKVVAGKYILQFESHVAHDKAHDFLRKRNVQYEVEHDYTAIFHGTAIRLLSDHDGPTLAQIPGIKNVWPSIFHKRITAAGPVAPSYDSADSADSAVAHTQGISRRALPPRGGSPDDASLSYLRMTNVDVLQEKYKLTGKGVKVAIVDTGVDYKHPAFALPGATEGCLGTSPDGTPCRFTHGYDFVGNDNSTDPNRSKEDADPMDCHGHGTHVAGIVGGDTRNLPKGAGPLPPRPFVGVAPEVTFGAYRVLDCENLGQTGPMIAGIHKAVEDKMDIINLSLGLFFAYNTSATAIAAEDAALKGALVIAAAGNHGKDGIGMLFDTSLAENVLGASSFVDTHTYYPFFGIAGKKHPYLISDFPMHFLKVKGPTYLYPLVDKRGVVMSGCDEAAYAGLKGLEKVDRVFVSSYNLTECPVEKLRVIAASHGAVAVFLTLEYEEIDYYDELVPSDPFPVGVVRMSSIREIIGNNKLPTVIKTPITWSTTEEPFTSPNPGAPAFSSSFGLDGNLRSKPDVGAPGGNIFSTWPLAKGGYKVISGTSMATPHIAGAYALYLQNKNYTKISSLDIRTIFKNTATIYARSGPRSVPVSAVKQGSGIIDALKAILTTTTLKPDHIDLLDSAHFKSKSTIVLTNSGKKAERYRLSHRPAQTLNSYPNGNTFPLGTPLIQRHAAKVIFPGSGLVQVNPGQSVNIEVRFEEPAQASPAQFPYYSGFIIATPTLDPKGVAVHIPYTGMRGLIAEMPMFDTNEKYPRLAKYNETTSEEIKLELDSQGNPAFVRQTGNITVALRLGSPSPMVQVTVYDANNTKSPLGFLNSSDSDEGFIASPFRRNMVDPNGKNGVYKYSWNGGIFPLDKIKNVDEFIKGKLKVNATMLEAGTYRVVVSAQKKMTTGRDKKDFVIHDLGKVTLL